MADVPAGLDPKTREIALALSANPMDLFQGNAKGYLEDFIRVTVGSTGGGGGFAPAPGFMASILKDLSAETGEYVYTDAKGVSWLYGNGVAVLRVGTYESLFAEIGTAFGVGNGSTTFNIPDGRGRAIFFTGTNASADLGDNEGLAESSRGAGHRHNFTLATDVHGHGVGSLAVSPSTHDHSYNTPTFTSSLAAGAFAASNATTGATTGGTSLSITGQTEQLAVTVSGTIGPSGSALEAPAHIHLGSLLIAF